MGLCQRCGTSRLMLKRSRCAGCGATGCESCQFVFAHTPTFSYTRPTGGSVVRVGRSKVLVPGSPGGYAAGNPVVHRVCSAGCFDQWAWRYIGIGQAPIWNGQAWTVGGHVLDANMGARAVGAHQDTQRRMKVAQAGSLLVAEDHEAAARIYQELGMYREAGEARRRGRHQVVTQVQVNVNDLIDRLRKAGISTDYTCPACRGHIRISGQTTVPTLVSCEYCGSTIQTTDLVEFLTKVVGYR